MNLVTALQHSLDTVDGLRELLQLVDDPETASAVVLVLEDAKATAVHLQGSLLPDGMIIDIRPATTLPVNSRPLRAVNSNCSDG